MTTSTMTAMFPTSVEQLWHCVTNLEDTTWRRDLTHTERRSETEFVEYPHRGKPVHFHITAAEPPHYWAFSMENEMMSGHWEGRFEAVKGGAALTFTERISPKHRWMIPFIPLYLKGQQRQYLRDLRQKLAERGTL